MTNKTIKIGIIGCGYWGPNLIRNFVSTPGCEMAGIADINKERLDKINRLYPFLKIFADPIKMLKELEIDAVVIVTPVSTHYSLAKEALNIGKHVLVEKPMTGTVSEAKNLIKLAKKKNKVLMVDHTFVYCGAVRKLRETIDKHQLGEIYYFDSVRVNLGLFQKDTNVLWDLAPHDFSIMSYLLDKKPIEISAFGSKPVSYGNKGLESMAYVTIRLEGNTLAHFHLNWLSPVKVRRILIGGSKKMAIYDHLDPDNQVKIYNKGVSIMGKPENRYKALVQYRIGEMFAPKVDQTEALETVCKHFIECIQKGKKPITDGEAGLKVVNLLEKAQKSMKNQGKLIKFL